MKHSVADASRLQQVLWSKQGSMHFAQLEDNCFPGKQPGEDQATAAEAQELIAEQSSCLKFMHFWETMHTVTWKSGPCCQQLHFLKMSSVL